MLVLVRTSHCEVRLVCCSPCACVCLMSVLLVLRTSNWLVCYCPCGPCACACEETQARLVCCGSCACASCSEDLTLVGLLWPLCLCF